MAELKTCLLVSSDPDDQQILCEAIKHVTHDAAILILPEVKCLVPLLKSNIISPNLIVVDPGMSSDFAMHFQELKRFSESIKLIIYSEDDHYDTEYRNINVSKRLPFSQLCQRLNEIFKTVS